MNTTDRQLLALLHSALWESPVDTSLFEEGTDRRALFSLAEKQTVVGLIYDVVLTLPTHLRPGSAILHPIHLQTIRTAQTHQLLNTTLAAIVSRLESEGIRPVLLKGQGVAQNYPIPLRRTCGDIDLYIGEPHYTRSCQLAAAWGMTDETATESIQHLHFQWKGVTIELHRIAGLMYSRNYNRAFRRWSDALLQGDTCRTTQINGKPVLLPPVRFDSLYIFYHTYKHFLTGGIGLRQLCDWAMYLHRFNHEIDRTVLMRDLKTLGLLRPWQVMGHIVVHHLGLPVEEFPFYDVEQKYLPTAMRMMDTILCNGNFGFHNPHRTARPNGYFAGKMHTFRATHTHLRQVFQLCPHDAWSYYFSFITTGIAQVLTDLFAGNRKPTHTI